MVCQIYAKEEVQGGVGGGRGGKTVKEKTLKQPRGERPASEVRGPEAREIAEPPRGGPGAASGVVAGALRLGLHEREPATVTCGRRAADNSCSRARHREEPQAEARRRQPRRRPAS